MSLPSALSSIKKIWHFLTRKERWQCGIMVVFALVTSCFEAVTAFIVVVFAQVLHSPEIGQVYSDRFLGYVLPAGKTVLLISVVMGIVYFVKNMFAAAEVFFQNFSIQRMNYRFKSKLLYRYARCDYRFYLTRNAATSSHVVEDDANNVFTVGMIALANVLSDVIILAGLTGFAIYMSPMLAIMVFVVGVPLGWLVSKVLFPLFYRWGKALQESGFHNRKNLLQFFHAFRDMILLGNREFFVRAYQKHSKRQSYFQALQVATSTVPRLIIEMIFVAVFVLAVVYLSVRGTSPGDIAGLLGGYLYVGFRLMPGLNRIIFNLGRFKLIVPSIEYVHKEYTAASVFEHYVDVPHFQFNRSIILKDVSFGYPSAKKQVLSQIDLTIARGECVGIVGKTGSGKSTLIDLISGLIVPQSGHVLIDDQFVAHSYQWHATIGCVPQHVYLIDDTIEANIVFGRPVTDEDGVHRSVDMAQMRAFVDGLPDGIQTVVGERGIRLSGGERQRISIARALYHGPEVLIF